MALFRVIGLPAASRLGGFIGRNIFCWLPPDKVARANLLRAFPGKSQEERDAIRRTMWDNLGRVVGEYPHLDKFTPKGEDPRITYNMAPGMSADGLKAQPLMFLSAHLANWEMMPILAQQLGFDAATMVRPPNNPFVADWVARSYFTRCLEGGVRIFGYQDAMIHVKTCTVDGVWSTVGTATRCTRALSGSRSSRQAATTSA